MPASKLHSSHSSVLLSSNGIGLIWYRTVTLCGWEDNRRPGGIALAWVTDFTSLTTCELNTDRKGIGLPAPRLRSCMASFSF